MRTSEKWDWLPSAGRWWRFSRYEIHDGMIRPSDGATLGQYDPWERFRGTRIRGDEWIPPYADFLNLRHQLGRSFKESENHVLRWCEQYGLLGLLLHQVPMATLAPRWKQFADAGQFPLPTQLSFVRTNTGWWTKRTIFQPGEIEFRSDVEGQLVPQAMAPAAWARTGVLKQGLRSPEIRQESFRETWWRFFPDVPEDSAEDYSYPPPLSEQFWREYAEPYGAFLEGLQCLSEALWEIDHHKPEADATPEDTKHVVHGVALLDALLAPASPTIVPISGGRFAQQWVCGSLLSAFAMMALQDKAEGRHVRNCDSCGRFFISQHPKALYCSPQCRWKTQKRRKRAAAKAKKSRPKRKRA